MVDLKFSVIVEHEGEVQVASGIITGCPSEEALREKLEEAGAAVFSIVEATPEEVAEAQAAKGEQ